MGAGAEMPAARPRAQPLLRYREDARTLAFCALYFTVTFALWRVDWAQCSWAAVAAAFSLVTFQAFQGCVTVHNCAHCPPFTSSTLNSWWFLVISAWNGASATAYIPGHNLGHHKYLQTRQDVIRTSKVNHRYQLLNLVTYFPRIYPSIYKNDMAYFEAQKALGRPVYRQFQMDTAAVLTLYAVCAILNLKSFLWLVLVPQILAKDMIVTLNLLQHDGCDPQHAVNHSRNFVGPVLNYLAFNNGYHAIHHMMPGKHWSRLPMLHAAKVAPFNHASLNHPNILAYLFTTFVFPSRRVNYDGSAYVNPGINGALGPDEPWHYAQESLNATNSNPTAQKDANGFGDEITEKAGPDVVQTDVLFGGSAKAKAT